MSDQHKEIFTATMAEHGEEVQQKNLMTFLGSTLLDISRDPEQDEAKTSEMLALAASQANPEDFMDLLTVHNEALVIRETIESRVAELAEPMPRWLAHICTELSRIQADTAHKKAERRRRQEAEWQAKQKASKRPTLEDLWRPSGRGWSAPGSGPIKTAARHEPGTTI